VLVDLTCIPFRPSAQERRWVRRALPKLLAQLVSGDPAGPGGEIGAVAEPGWLLNGDQADFLKRVLDGVVVGKGAVEIGEQLVPGLQDQPGDGRGIAHDYQYMTCGTKPSDIVKNDSVLRRRGGQGTGVRRGLGLSRPLPGIVLPEVTGIW